LSKCCACLKIKKTDSYSQMPNIDRLVSPGSKERIVITDNGEVLTPPDDWIFLPAGDGPLTRMVKQRCSTWQVQVRKGRRIISKGIWAEKSRILEASEELAVKRATPEYEKRRSADLKRRKIKHEKYVKEFYLATIDFLSFNHIYSRQMQQLARAVTVFAAPVGSGTVARTERIPLKDRVQAAVIAWLRHQTTAYDSMSIARVKGTRREVRKKLAQQSLDLLERYRSGAKVGAGCPLKEALARLD
jgi:hypothetical protein